MSRTIPSLILAAVLAFIAGFSLRGAADHNTIDRAIHAAEDAQSLASQWQSVAQQWEDSSKHFESVAQQWEKASNRFESVVHEWEKSCGH